jgi:plastocyanin
VTKAGFTPACAKVKRKGQFFFANDDTNTPHEVATKPGSPTSFDVKLPKKQSTYTQVFSKKGTYVIVDKTTNKSMTLFVLP